MIPKENSWSIVILGYWNRMIFTPAWVGRNVFDTDVVECLVSVMPQAPTIFKKDGISLLVKDDRLVLRAEELFSSKIILAEQKARKIIDDLPHTPLSAIGINFGYVVEEQDHNEILLNLFNHDDDSAFTQSGWQISKRTITRTFEKEETPKYLFNYTLSFGKRIEIDANYHHPVANSTEALAALNGRSEGLLNEFNRVLSSVYSLVQPISIGE